MDTKRTARNSSLAIAGLLMAAGMSAAEPQAATQDTSVTVQGVQVAIDPATGQLVAPTAEQRAALSRAMLEQSAAAPAARSARRANAAPRDEAEARQTLHTIRLQNGGHALGMEVPESLMSSLAAERRADGSLSIHHQGESGQAAAEVTQ
ncbi:hypothetical protein RLIN73S_06215 [Rhodanobacter lindaniclasticus]